MNTHGRWSDSRRKPTAFSSCCGYPSQVTETMRKRVCVCVLIGRPFSRASESYSNLLRLFSVCFVLSSSFVSYRCLQRRVAGKVNDQLRSEDCHVRSNSHVDSNKCTEWTLMRRAGYKRDANESDELPYRSARSRAGKKKSANVDGHKSKSRSTKSKSAHHTAASKSKSAKSVRKANALTMRTTDM